MSRRVALALAGFLACSRPPETAPGGDGGAAAADAHPRDAGDELDAGPTGVPDLTLDLVRARVDLSLREKFYSLDSCELDADEDCIGGAGTRRLLGFSIRTPNVGTGDLFLGHPTDDNPAFHYSECHDHYHFQGYAEYRLVDAEGGDVAVGRKQAFCLLDSERWLTDDPTVSTTPRYRCEYQGIQRGWADSYTSHLPCQFIDVTGVPSGSYALEVELNGEHTLVELDYDNNQISIPIDLDDPALATPTEPCPTDIDPAASAGIARECGWTAGPTFSCEPGEIGRVGCSSACGLGTCDGNPMLRVCDAARPDGNCTHPAAVDPAEPGGGESNDFAGPCPCDLSVQCPPSGEIQVFTAPFRDGDPYHCELAFEQ